MRYHRMYIPIAGFIVTLYVLAFLLDSPANIFAGLKVILAAQDVLITDYMAIGGMGAAFFNSATVLLETLIVLRIANDPPNGFTIVTIGLMGGFALFGKNFLNILPILCGTMLYCKIADEPFSKHFNSSLVGTSLAPLVSFTALTEGGWGMPLLGIFIGIFIGFIISPLCAYTFRIQNGMNLYNGGFACGMIAMILVPLLSTLGLAPSRALHWATGLNLPLGIFLYGLCIVFLVGGVITGGGHHAFFNYWRLLNTSGRAPSDFLRMFGPAPVLLNMGVCGIVATSYILLIGGDLNGPTLGGIFTIIGFAAYGKHPFNMVPVMVGLFLGALASHWEVNYPSLQIAGLFCTTLAPLAGYFGPFVGVLAGFCHSAVVLFAGSPVEGVNLYNNGFSGGITAIVLYPVLMSAFKHRIPELQNMDYFEAFTSDEPLYPRFRHSYRKNHWVNNPVEVPQDPAPEDLEETKK